MRSCPPLAHRVLIFTFVFSLSRARDTRPHQYGSTHPCWHHTRHTCARRGVRCERGRVAIVALSRARVCARVVCVCARVCDRDVYMCTATRHCWPRLPSLRSLFSLQRHTHHTHTYTVTSHELSHHSQRAHTGHSARTHLSDTRRRRRRRRRHPPGRSNRSGTRPAVHARAPAALAATFARCGVPWPLRRRRRPRSTEAARAREGFERRLASPRLVGRSAPVARAACALAVRAPAAIASAAAAERGDEEGEAILRAVVGRGSAPTGSACSFSSRGARLQAETARGTRVRWSWVALEPGVTRGSAHQRAARMSLPGGRAEPWGRGGPRGGSAAAETDLSLGHPPWTTLNEPPRVDHPERPIPKTAPTAGRLRAARAAAR